MITTRKVEAVSTSIMDDIGFTWHTDADGSNYVPPELIEVTNDEVDDYYVAANELYDMYVEAAEHVIENGLYEELGIPENLIEIIETSWEDDDWHLYGRFDLAGGIDGEPIKLIEFNADTPTSLFETSIIQWATLKSNGMDENAQFNNVYEMMRDNFQRLITNEDGLERFDEYYNGESILFSSARNLPEDEQTVKLLQRVANDAGFKTEFCYMDEVGFVAEDGIFNAKEERFDFWFKLWPWEDIAQDEEELTDLMTQISANKQGVIINPAYTLLFQSKGILKVLYELFPDSPYLLETDYEPLEGVKQIAKPLFGREGANMAIIEEDGSTSYETKGDYDKYDVVYQEFIDFPKDDKGQSYQAGVFFAYEGCALGFRRGGDILDDGSKFISHVILEDETSGEQGTFMA